MRTVLFVMVQLGFAVFVAIPSIALACSCLDSGADSLDKVVDAVCSVDVVFVGKVTAKSSMRDGAQLVTIEPITVFRGNVRQAVKIEEVTTCDPTFSLGQSFLIFGDLDGETQNVTTSICGPSRFTGKLADAQYQLGVVREQAANFDELCGAIETSARRERIIVQDRENDNQANAQRLRSLKEGLRQSGLDSEKSVEDVRPTQKDTD